MLMPSTANVKNKVMPQRFIPKQIHCTHIVCFQFEEVTQRIASILDMVDQMQAVDTSAVEPMANPLDASQRDLLKALKSRVREIGADLGTAPEVLFQSGDYDLLVRGEVGDSKAAPRHWQGWRRERVIEPLQAILSR